MALQKDELPLLVSMWNFKSWNSQMLIKNNFCSPSTSWKTMTPCTRFLEEFLKWICRYGCLGLKKFPPTPLRKFQYVDTINSITYLICNTHFPTQASLYTSFFDVFRQNYLASSVTQAAHLCISDQKHLQRKHCIKIPGFGLSFPGLWECLGLLNSDPSVSLRLHKGKHKFSIICMFTTPTSSVSYTLRTLWILLRSFGGNAPIPETTMLLSRAGLDPTCGSKHPPSHQSWSHLRSWGGGVLSQRWLQQSHRAGAWWPGALGECWGSLLLPRARPNSPSRKAG